MFFWPDISWYKTLVKTWFWKIFEMSHVSTFQSGQNARVNSDVLFFAYIARIVSVHTHVEVVITVYIHAWLSYNLLSNTMIPDIL